MSLLLDGTFEGYSISVAKWIVDFISPCFPPRGPPFLETDLSFSSFSFLLFDFGWLRKKWRHFTDFLALQDDLVSSLQEMLPYMYGVAVIMVSLELVKLKKVD
jgi:hypothetical protein